MIKKKMSFEAVPKKKQPVLKLIDSILTH